MIARSDFRIAREMGLSFSYVIDCRIRYLESQFDIWRNWQGDVDDVDIAHIWAWQAHDEILKLVELKKRYSQRQAKKEEQITDTMIQAARDYPITQLIDFNRGKALAFCHADKNPSLSYDSKRNKAHCFVCDKDYDSIAILMERDNITFPQAVRALQ